MNILATKEIISYIQEVMTEEMLQLCISDEIDKLIMDGFGSYLNYEDSLLQEVLDEFEDEDGIEDKADAERLIVISAFVDELFEQIPFLNINEGDDEENSYEEIKEELSTALFIKSKRYTKNEIYSNPFLKNIKTKPYKAGKYELDTFSSEKGEIFYYNSDEIDGIYHLPCLGYCSSKFDFPIIGIKDTYYHYVTPHVINLYKPILKQVQGKVLSLGLGIGYFEYMASLKDTVEKVTVVEKDPDLIKIFTDIILPQCECKNKIEIINANPAQYAKKIKNGQFDTCVVDVSADPEEILETYIRLKPIEKINTKTKFLFYDEPSILLDIQPYVLMSIMDDIDPSNANEEDFDFIKNDYILKKLNEIYKDVLITDLEELKEEISIEGIKKRIQEFF